MDIENLKQWIANNLQYSRGLICKKCKREWFEKYGFINQWDRIHVATQFLDNLLPTFPQRVWHIVNDSLTVKCNNPSCQNTPQFWSFNVGYLRTCSNSCAQYDPNTINKIQATNLKKYGCKYGLENRDVILKREATMGKKYGVENISQVDGISEKKQETCLKNYGSKWFLERSDLIKKCINNKYGVDNVQQVTEIADKSSCTKMDNFYELLLESTRFEGKVTPSFSKEEYNGTCRKYKFICNVCKLEFEYELRWDRIPRCPVCYKSSSVFEKDVSKYVKSILPTASVIENTKSVLANNYELDIYIPSKNIAIECNGLFWHGEVGGNKNKNYHLLKTIECESKGIHLIHIFEDEWNNKNLIIKEKLKYIIGNIKPISVYARKCKIINVSISDKKEFLNQNHIQGNDTSKIHIGLEWESKLVSAMTFSSKRCFIGYKNKTKNDEEFELCRYTSLSGHSVIGGASKLLSHFIKMYCPKKIISYADRRWTYSKDNLYEKIGFEKVSDGTPNYWYFGRDGNYRRLHRFGFRKNVLSKRLAIFDSNLTEWENMQLNGWDRIWDCGSLKYEMVV